MVEQKEAGNLAIKPSCSTPIQPRQAGKVGNLTSSPPQSSPSHGHEVNLVQPEDFSDDPEFIVKGVNLILDVPAKSKKPTLYATALMTHLFKDKEMREGCVEPGNMSKKKSLDQTKINLIKKCIRVKFTEKIYERSWPEIRTSMNQKCLDKLKYHLKHSKGSTSSQGSPSSEGSD
ncbi:hypothetical protein OS493_020781 [Desmophyllum pertusum]|uniref:BEN domain-containing protein n=1 Tax=Desmophyllum pertusum TaxID=174260 RepID=A0A9W9YP85_9CNID|nr:hypothetical protein OS493_020781 [Desmophyllum pertusum]